MILAYFRSLAARFFHRSQTENDLEEELRSHIQLRADELERFGLGRAEAERRARIEFGSQEKFREECREAIAGNFIDVLLQDVRFSLRMLRKSPGFAAIVVLTIALGIGATTAIFSVVDATLLKPLPYSHPEELISIESDLPGINAHDVGMSQPEWQDLQQSGIFEYVSPTWFDENNLTGSSQPARVRLLIVAPDYFALLRAQSRLNGSVASLQTQFPTDYPNGWGVRLRPLKDIVVGDVRQPLLLLLGAVGLVLLIGCVNVANLLLARASARAHEMAIRRALGAGRARLIRQLLTESVILSLVGGTAGVAIVFAAREPLLRLIPETLPRLNDTSISWSVLIFAVIVSILSGVIFGLAPALQAGRLNLNHALNQDGRGSTGSGERARTRRLLVIAEFALSFVLMIAAGLLLHSFWDLRVA